MKLVTAVIKPLKLEEVCDALADIGIVGITVLEVKGYGRQRGHAETYHGSDYTMHKIEMAVTDDMADQVVETIITAAQTGRVGDGKIFVLDLGQVVRIRTRETGAAAI